MKLAALAISLSLGFATAASAATLQPVGDFDQPIFVTSAPLDPNRLLIVEREGRVLEASAEGFGEFADLTALVACCASERGMLSIAPAPDFDASGRFYAAYTGKEAAGGEEGDIHVDAFRPDDAGGLLREPILSVGHSFDDTHHGGQLQLGPDGHLYLSSGDGGGAGDPLGSGQNLATLLGKILRFEPRPGAVPEIWSYGLRNPWRFSFDRTSGDMVIADVGQGMREEVDLAPSPTPGAVGGAGANYGWNCREGFIAYPSAPPSCTGAGGFTDPVFDYPHLDPEDGSAHGCAITGGYVVRDTSLGDLYGRYVYADFCIGEIRSLELPASAGEGASGDRSEGLTVANPTSFGEDACGRVYVASNAGTVYRLVGEAPASCPSPSSSAGAAGASAEQAVSASVGGKAQPARVHLTRRSRPTAAGLRLVLTARASPCPAQAGAAVQLKRGGHRIERKPLNRRCLARFRLRVDRRSTFRALLFGPAGGTLDRSPPLLITAFQAAG
ncbi:MAG: PQQ-dependent sugar dehydrogenase [Solirubrobacterales bacterium]